MRKGFLEHSQFLALRQELPDEINPLLTFGYYTGCRRAEILSLRWSQVDFVRGLVRLEPGTTKNDEPRTLPLVPGLFKVLSMQKAIRTQNAQPAVGFSSAMVSLSVAFRGACKTAGLVDEDGQPAPIFHDLRRTGVRNLVRAGIPERVAMAISGHKTRSVFDRYNITSEAGPQEAAVRLDE